MSKSRKIIEEIWKPLVIFASLTFLYWSIWLNLGLNWWTDENYSHGLLVPFLIVFIIWIDFSKLKSRVEKPQMLIGGILVSAAFVVLLGGTLGAELFLQRISMVIMISGVLVFFWGIRLLQSLLVPFALLLFAIPIPQIIFNKIAFPLQLWASQLAVWGIRVFEVASVRKGNVIEILPRGSQQIISLEVVEACSGIRSLMTLMTIALVLGYFTRRRGDSWTNGLSNLIKSFDFWRTVTLILMAIPIAIITNGGRVTATSVLTYNYGKQALEGFAHSSAGWIVYVAALILLIIINWILVFGKRLIVGKSL